MNEERPARLLGPLLLTLIIAMPGLFCWFLLRKGYASSLRVAGFTYAGSMAAVAVLGAVAR